MSEYVEVTEWIRFNDDGSADHLKVVGDQLVDSRHWKVSPYVRTSTDIAWAVHVHPEGR